MAEEIPSDAPRDGRQKELAFPQPPRFLVLKRTGFMVIWISLVWALIEMSRFVITGECGWHDRDGSIFAATALVGTFGFIAEVADHRIWPVGSNGFLSAGYYFLVALSGAPLAYFY